MANQNRKAYIEGIIQDAYVLESLLKKNRCDHSKTLYYQRLSMVYRAMERYQVVNLFSQLELLQKQINSTVNNKKKLNIKKKRKAECDLQQSQQTKSDNQLDIETKLDNLFVSCTQHLPEIMSRIEHASIPLCSEISRGFFMPFCTVAIGTIARIRVLIMRIGQILLSELLQINETIKDTFGSTICSIQVVDKVMNIFAQYPPKDLRERPQSRNLTLQSIGFTPKKSAQQKSTNNNNNNNVKSSNATTEKNNVEPLQEQQVTNDVVPGAETKNLHEIVNNEDLGTNVLESAVESDDIILSTKAKKLKTSCCESDDVVDDPVDQNKNFLALYQAKQQNDTNQQKQKSKKKKSRNKSNKEASKKDKKKKKKDQNGDFFDNLFG